MSISIDNGAAYTPSPTVTLTLGAPANTTQMRFGNDGKSYGAWQAFAASTSYALPSGDGDKTVYVQFADVDGNVLAAESATIVLDTQAPRGTFTIQEAPITTSTSVHLTLNATDVSDVAYRLKNGAESDWTGWTPLTKGSDVSVPWTLTSGDGLKTVDLQLRDAAGNTATLTAQIQLETSTPSAGLWLTFKTPDYDGNKKESYFRIGAAKTTAEDALLASGAVSANTDAAGKILPGSHASAGWFEYTDGDRTIVTRGFHADSVGGDRIESTEGDVLTYIKGKQVSYSQKSASVTASTTHAFNWGDTIALYGGIKYYATVGTAMSSTIGSNVGISASVDLGFNLSHKLDVSLGTKFSWGTDELKHVTRSGTKAKKSIHFRIKSTPEAHLIGNKKAMKLLAAGTLGAAAAVTSTIGLSALGEKKPDDLTGAATMLGVGATCSIGALVASIVVLKLEKMKALLEKIRYAYTFSQNGAPVVVNQPGKMSDAEVSITKQGILLSKNDAAGLSLSMITLDKDVKLLNQGAGAVSLLDDGDIYVSAKKNAVVYGDAKSGLTAGVPLFGVNVDGASGSIKFNGTTADFFNGVLTVTK